MKRKAGKTILAMLLCAAALTAVLLPAKLSLVGAANQFEEETGIVRLDLFGTKTSYDLEDEITGQVTVTGVTNDNETADLTGDSALEYSLLQNDDVFSVTQLGEITALSEGAATLVVTYGEIEARLYMNAYFPEEESLRTASSGPLSRISREEQTQVPMRSATAGSIEVQVAAGNYFSAVLREDGTVWTWGYNSVGQLGNGTTTNQSTPKQIPGLTEVVQIAAGYQHMLVLKSDGSVWAWGQGGLLGDGSYVTRTSPIQIPGLTDITQISTTYTHSLALKSDGTLYGWGSNDFGEAGSGGISPSAITTNVSDSSAGNGYSAAAKNDGTAWWWGRTDTYMGYQPNPSQISGAVNIVKVKAAPSGALLLKDDGTVSIKVRPDRYFLGGYTTVSGLSGIVEFGAGNNSYAIGENGELWNLHYSTGTYPPDPGSGISYTYVSGAGATQDTSFQPLKAVSVADYYSHRLAVTQNGGIYGMGNNSYHQVQAGLGSNITSPVLLTLPDLLPNITYFINEEFSTDLSGWELLKSVTISF